MANSMDAEPETGPDSAVPASALPAMFLPFDDLRLRVPAHAALTELTRMAASGDVSFSADGNIVDLTEDALAWCYRAAGQLRIAAILAALGPEWTLLHSVPIQHPVGDIHHLAVGPSGVFVISTENLLSQNEPQRAPSRRRLGRTVERLLTATVGFPVPVTEVVVTIGGTCPASRKTDSGILELRDEELLDLLEGPAAVSPEQLEQIAETAVLRATWHRTPEADVDVSMIAGALAVPSAVRVSADRVGPVSGALASAPPPTALDSAPRPVGPHRGTNGAVGKIALVLTAGVLALPIVGAVAAGVLTLVFGFVQ